VFVGCCFNRTNALCRRKSISQSSQDDENAAATQEGDFRVVYVLQTKDSRRESLLSNAPRERVRIRDLGTQAVQNSTPVICDGINLMVSMCCSSDHKVKKGLIESLLLKYLYKISNNATL